MFEQPFAEYGAIDWQPSSIAWSPGMLLAGVDEVGRGPLVGAVVAAAVVLDPAFPIVGLADSKKLSARRRHVLAQLVRERALGWSLGRAEPSEIDEMNILHASLLAMQRAIGGLSCRVGGVLIDGNRLPALDMPAEAIVKGDARVPAISAAAIIAKVARDEEMVLLHQQYPDYGFDRHKGYPTAEHLDALKRLGPLSEHRRSFAPVAALLERGA